MPSTITDRELLIATAGTRTATTWKNTHTTWADFLEKISDPRIGADTTAQYAAMSKTDKDRVKDVGGYVGGHLRGGRRTKTAVIARSMIILDLDNPPIGLHQHLGDLFPYECALYSTRSHAPTKPRYRLATPITRDVTPDEYEAVARRLAADLGIDYFDDTTFEPSRLMYWPSRAIDQDFIFVHNEGPWVNPDDVLARYVDWRDISTWPVSSRMATNPTRGATHQADPTTKPGVVGAFCRAHTITSAIETYLTDTYTPTTVEGRYTYTRGESTAGLVIYDDTLAYSHHATDPASAGGHAVNAFDLVRIHRFGAHDEEAKPGTATSKLPSFGMMQTLALKDEATKKQLAADRLEEARADFDATGNQPTPPDDSAVDWLSDLETNKRGEYVDTVDNLARILQHDPNCVEPAYNELKGSLDVRDNRRVPWTRPKPGWTDTDHSHLTRYVETTYRIYNQPKLEHALNLVASGRAYHPVRDMLNNLPTWDGQSRVDTLLTDTLGADDNPYTRAVTRKFLCAAVARILKPGTKFDHVLILVGPQGCGKSTIFNKLGGAWYSDALTIADMRDDKKAAEKLLGHWILELSELSGMRKTEVEPVKAFISRTEDTYRPAYGRHVETWPRQCVFGGSTNSQDGFLRDNTGNRRFWPVPVTGAPGKEGHHPWALTTDYIQQVWAETLHLYKAGERLTLNAAEAALAQQAQEDAVEIDDRAGLVSDYLDTLLPSGWHLMGLKERLTWLGVTESPFETQPVEGDTRREEVTNIEIWAEVFGRDPGEMTKKDSYEIASILETIPGWERTNQSKRIPIYGKQRLYKRSPDEQPPF